MAQRFNIYNFTGSYRPVLEGVYHDGGYKVATDAIVMAAVKSDYPEELEHRIVTKDGREIEGKYPRWQDVIPDKRDYTAYTVDTARYEAFVKERRQSWKADTGKGTKWQEHWAVKVGPAYLKARNFDKFLAGMKEIGATEIMVKDGRRTVYAKTDKGVVLIFPMLVDRPAGDMDTVTLS